MQGSLFPDSVMELRISSEVLIAPIIGGLGSLFGPIVGAFFVVCSGTGCDWKIMVKSATEIKGGRR